MYYENVIKKEYDENGRVIYVKLIRDELGMCMEVEYWYKYDGRGNCIHFEDSLGFSYDKRYNDKNKCINYINSDGKGYTREYDENGKCTEHKTFTILGRPEGILLNDEIYSEVISKLDKSLNINDMF